MQEQLPSEEKPDIYLVGFTAVHPTLQ